VPVYHEMRTGRFLRVQCYFRAKQISNFLISTQVHLSTELISTVAGICNPRGLTRHAFDTNMHIDVLQPT